MLTPNAQLTSILNTFANNTGGTSAQPYQVLTQTLNGSSLAYMINSNPYALKQLNTVFSSGENGTGLPGNFGVGRYAFCFARTLLSDLKLTAKLTRKGKHLINGSFNLINITVVIFTFFLSFMTSIAQAAKAPSLELKPPNIYRCDSSSFELFSCQMVSGRSVAICLSKEANPHLSIIYTKKYSGNYSYIIENPEQVVGSNAHGDMTIISGDVSNDKIFLFIDTNHYDPAMAAITHNKNSTAAEFCRNSNFSTNSYYNKINKNYINIFSLINLGVTKPLAIVPEWPSK